jgi:trehalose 6-phosphate phosphatase
MDKVQYFFKDDNTILKNNVRCKIALFFDFDGTLVPIQKDPEQCFLSKKLKNQLLALSNSQCCYLIILSGRSLSDIKKRIGIRRLYYGGNHGLDISGPNLRFTHPKALTSKLDIQYITRKLKKEITNIEGAWLENKKFSVSLHFRSVKKENVMLVKKIFQAVANEFIEGKRLNVIKGKKVIELTPNVSWNKGSAVLWILKQLKDKCMPLYIGDDQTDETAFKALNGSGVTIRVGKSKNTAANYYLKGHWEVLRLLSDLKKEIFYSLPETGKI